MTKQRFQNTLYTNDNLFILHGMNSEIVDLIYLDPPFNSKRMYSAPLGSKSAGVSFKDMWEWKDVNEHYLDALTVNYPALVKYIASVGEIHSNDMMAYLTYMAQRIIEMYRVLKSTGSLYLHCDQTASHYLKVLLDEVFGKNNFRNEIVWHYSGWNAKLLSSFNSRHDSVLFYAKDNRQNFNSYAEPWDSEEEYLKIRKQKVYVENDRKYVLSDRGNGQRVKRYVEDAMKYGKPVDDVWDIDKINNSSKEATGYPTQKPLALLHRIVKASSNEGDIVLDPFCGCATTCVAAQQLNRHWIGIDIAEQAAEILISRISDDTARSMFKDFITTKQVPKRTDIKEVKPSESVKERLYREQSGKCLACGGDFEHWNLEIDHIIPKSKGGGDYLENYQLLCGSCNRIKGNRTMEYLRLKIETREKMMKNKIRFGG